MYLIKSKLLHSIASFAIFQMLVIKKPSIWYKRLFYQNFILYSVPCTIFYITDFSNWIYYLNNLHVVRLEEAFKVFFSYRQITQAFILTVIVFDSEYIINSIDRIAGGAYSNFFQIF